MEEVRAWLVDGHTFKAGRDLSLPAPSAPPRPARREATSSTTLARLIGRKESIKPRLRIDKPGPARLGSAQQRETVPTSSGSGFGLHAQRSAGTTQSRGSMRPSPEPTSAQGTVNSVITKKKKSCGQYILKRNLPSHSLVTVTVSGEKIYFTNFHQSFSRIVLQNNFLQNKLCATMEQVEIYNWWLELTVLCP